MRNTDKIEELISGIINDLGYEIVRVQLSGRDNPTLQIMLERADREPIDVEDCAKASRAISDVLDENISYEYFLEVSSTGVDRPLTKLSHFARFVGSEAKVETISAVEMRKRFGGKIVSANDKGFVIETDGENYEIEIDNVAKAKLVVK